MLKILTDNHPILKQVAVPIQTITPELRQLASDMFATMHLSNGIGLAAPQVGESIRLLVFDCVQHTYNSMDSGFLFNPEIIEKSEETKVDKEGCLSYPGITCQVERNLRIKVKFIDLAGKEQVRVYSGLAARVVQHELDHLNGITMQDRENDSSN